MCQSYKLKLNLFYLLIFSSVFSQKKVVVFLVFPDLENWLILCSFVHQYQHLHICLLERESFSQSLVYEHVFVTLQVV